MVTAPGHSLDDLLSALASKAKPAQTNLLPWEVALERDKNGAETLIEFFPDSGACESHWVGVRRRTPLDANGKPLTAKATYEIGNSTERYEHGLGAFAQKQYQQAFDFLAPSATWSPQMREATMRRLAAAHADTKYLDTLEKVRLSPGAKVTLRAEPHPDGKELAVLRNGDGSDLRRVSSVASRDGYVRVGTSGQWDLIAVIGADGKLSNLGFILRAPGSQGRLERDADGTRLAMVSGGKRANTHVN